MTMIATANASSNRGGAVAHSSSAATYDAHDGEVDQRSEATARYLAGRVGGRSPAARGRSGRRSAEKTVGSSEFSKCRAKGARLASVAEVVDGLNHIEGGFRTVTPPNDPLRGRVGAGRVAPASQVPKLVGL